MPDRVARAIVGLVKETTVGTFVEPAASDSFFAREITLPDPPEPFRRNDTRTHHGKNDNVANPARIVDIGFTVDWIGAAAAGTAPYYRKLLLACGLRESDNGVTDVSYFPWSTYDNATAVGPPTTENPYAGASLAVWEEGRRYGLAGANGNVVLKGAGGQIVEAAFSFKGAMVDTSDDATPPTGVLPSAITSLTTASVPLTLHASSVIPWDSFEFDLGNEIVPLSDARNAAHQYATWIKDRMPTMKLVCDMLPIATFDFFGRQKSQVTGNLTLGPFGSVAGNRFTLSSSRVQIVKCTAGERDGGRTVELGIEPKAGPAGAEGSDFTWLWS